MHEKDNTLISLLRRRGFKLFRQGSEQAVFVPHTDELKEQFYKLMQHYAFRILLRDILKQHTSFSIEDITRYATKNVTVQYLNFLIKASLVEQKEEKFIRLKPEINSFGDTLEWYVAEILRREFDIECLWGISFKGTSVGGDYDVLGSLDHELLYIEVKSSPPRQIYDNDVVSFMERVNELCPELAIFLVDTHLRMKDKIVVLFEEALKQKNRQINIKRIQNEIFLVPPIIYITNSKPSISSNLQFIISHYYRRLCHD